MTSGSGSLLRQLPIFPQACGLNHPHRHPQRRTSRDQQIRPNLLNCLTSPDQLLAAALLICVDSKHLGDAQGKKTPTKTGAGWLVWSTSMARSDSLACTYLCTHAPCSSRISVKISYKAADPNRAVLTSHGSSFHHRRHLIAVDPSSQPDRPPVSSMVLSNPVAKSARRHAAALGPSAV